MAKTSTYEKESTHRLIDTCAREPIHIPGSIQAHGVMVIVDPHSLTIRDVSENAEEVFGVLPDDVLGQPLGDALPTRLSKEVMMLVHRAEEGSVGEFVRLDLGEEAGSTYDVIAHRSTAGTIVEFEITHGASITSPLELTWPAVSRIIDDLKSAPDISSLCEMATSRIQEMTGFARVKIYRFTDNWDGEVVAESNDGSLPSYLGLHFPSSDIPEQARKLYSINRIRLIPNVEYEPVPLLRLGDGGGFVDMSFSVLRSVSPVHIEYLKNMDVGASMSVSIMKENRLWGLIACHHSIAHHVSYPTRAACSLIAELLGFLLASRQEQEDATKQGRISETQARLLEALVRGEDYQSALIQNEDDFLGLVDAAGAAFVNDDVISTVGSTPPVPVIARLAQLIKDGTGDDVFPCANVPARFPGVEADPRAAGLLSIAVSRLGQKRLIWFRPEIVEDVVWAGNPDKSVQATRNGDFRLHPRRSFEQWKTERRGQSREWLPAEVQAAAALRNSIMDVALVRADRLAKLNSQLGKVNDLLVKRNRELQEFTYVASHDLQEPLRKIQSFAHLLTEEYREEMDDTAMFYLDRMQVSAERVSVLFTNLLEYSRLVEPPEHTQMVDTNAVLRQVVRSLNLQIDDAGGAVTCEDELPEISADPRRISRLFECLIDNAIKFRHPERPLLVRITGGQSSGTSGQPVAEIAVSDNGIGFEGHLADRAFNPFEQLHARDAYGGTGIGLALVRRIVEQLGGSAAATSQPDVGTTITVRIPL